MTIQFKHYKEEDFIRVISFIKDIFGKWPVGYVFLPARWEYIIFHPNVLPLKKEGLFEKCGLWEENGKIVGFAHFESQVGEVYLDVDPDYKFLYSDMIQYAENNLYEIKEDGQKYIEFHVTESNETLKSLLVEKGYFLDLSYSEVYYGCSIPANLSVPDQPEGLSLRSVIKKVDDERRLRILWRGFDHAGEPDPNDLWMSEYMQSAPGYDPFLNVVIENEDGNFVAYAGFWFDEFNRVAYVEPVCVDPEYRRMGLATIALTEGLRRCKTLGAESVYVASDANVYKSLGFSHVNTNSTWAKKW